MTPSRYNPRINIFILYPMLFILHVLLHRYLAAHDIVSRVFAAGPHTSPVTLLWILSFVCVRLFIFLALPALAAWHATRWLIQRGRPPRK
jgi:hypothetical protein